MITVGAVDSKILEAEGAASTDATNKANNALDAALAAFVGAGNVRDHTIISGGKIIAGLIDVDAIKAAAGFFKDIEVTGNSFLRDVHVTGNSSFEGEIYSGPLELSNNTSPGETVTYPAGSYVPEGWYEEIIGTYNGVAFDGWRVWTDPNSVSYNSQFNYSQGYVYIRFFKNGYWVTSAQGQLWQRQGRYTTSEGYYTNTTITGTRYIPSGSKTFKLLNLPTNKSSVTGVVYVDSNGFLKLS